MSGRGAGPGGEKQALVGGSGTHHCHRWPVIVPNYSSQLAKHGRRGVGVSKYGALISSEFIIILHRIHHHHRHHYHTSSSSSPSLSSSELTYVVRVEISAFAAISAIIITKVASNYHYHAISKYYHDHVIGIIINLISSSRLPYVVTCKRREVSVYIAIRVGQLQNRWAEIWEMPNHLNHHLRHHQISPINKRQVQTLVVYFLTDNKCTRGKCFAPTF